MRRSSAPERWLGPAASRPDGSTQPRRAQTEPFAALVAVVVVALALALYAGVLETSLPGPVDRDAAEPAADRVERALTVGGVARPARLGDATAAGPDGYRMNLTLVTGVERRSVGPEPPVNSDNATRRVSVARGSGTVGPGRLEVRVWT
jgi:hypothetical protein